MSSHSLCYILAYMFPFVKTQWKILFGNLFLEM